jgi:hypothetical protein
MFFILRFPRLEVSLLAYVHGTVETVLQKGHIPQLGLDLDAVFDLSLISQTCFILAFVRFSLFILNLITYSPFF